MSRWTETFLTGNVGGGARSYAAHAAVILNVVRWRWLIADAFTSTVRIGAGMSDHRARDVGLAAEPTHHVRSR
jgi:hypothetical protein